MHVARGQCAGHQVKQRLGLGAIAHPTRVLEPVAGQQQVDELVVGGALVGAKGGPQTRLRQSPTEVLDRVDRVAQEPLGRVDTTLAPAQPREAQLVRMAQVRQAQVLDQRGGLLEPLRDDAIVVSEVGLTHPRPHQWDRPAVLLQGRGRVVGECGGGLARAGRGGDIGFGELDLGQVLAISH